MNTELPLSVTTEVRERCLCLHLQRAARTIGRRFDEALRPFDITHGQYSLLMSLNRAAPPRISEVARLLAMDRTTLTANLKPLERRGLLVVSPDPRDRRSRQIALTDAGRYLLKQAVVIWRKTHDEVDRLVEREAIGRLRADLRALSGTGASGD